MKPVLVVNQKVAALLLLVFFVAACTPLIGPYSPKAYENATSLKVQTLALMDKATEPYAKHKAPVESLMVELQKACEYVRGVESNSLSARQWEILIDKDGDLAGRFFSRWKERSTLSDIYITEFKNIMSDAFDEIIFLEAGKKKAGR